MGLAERIAINRLTATPDGQGGQLPGEPELIRSTLAEITEGKFRRTYTEGGKRITLPQEKLFVVWFDSERPELLPGDTINYRDKVYVIATVEWVDARKLKQRLTAVEA